MAHNFCNIEDSNLIFGMHVYLMELHILNGERSRSSFKVNYMGQTRSFNVHFCNIEASNLIFGMHVYVMELHIVNGERSRSTFKVKGHIYGDIVFHKHIAC